MSRSFLAAAVALAFSCGEGGGPGEVPGDVIDVPGEVPGDVIDVPGEVPGDVIDVPGEVPGDAYGDVPADFVPPVCGDGMCTPGETSNSCPADCGSAATCGDGICDKAAGECETCGEDCETCCGDGECDEWETCETCVDDCGACPACGDGQCAGGETCTECPGDCGECPPCGDGFCDKPAGECQSCGMDCGVCCGDGACDTFETCGTCPSDCGDCPKAVLCAAFGQQGTSFSCPVVLAADSQGSPKAAGFQLDFWYDSAALTFAKFHDELCQDGGGCIDWDIPPNNVILPSGHTLAYLDVEPGHMRFLVYHGSDPFKPVTEAYMTGGTVSGDGEVFDIVFTVNQTIQQGSAEEVTVTDGVATDKDANKLALDLVGGVLVTSLP